MHLTPQQFDEQLTNDQLFLSLIGMSNVGKSYLSKKLVREGFRHICVDDLIEQALAHECVKQGISGVAAWLGLPDSPDFQKNETRYLSLESHAMRACLRRFASGNIILDTTGSVVHLSRDVLHTLRTQTLVVWIDISPDRQETMFEQFLREPKPVIFDGHYGKEKNQTAEEALRASYRDLLRWRSLAYQSLADVRIRTDELKEPFTEHHFLSLIKNAL